MVKCNDNPTEDSVRNSLFPYFFEQL